MILFEDVVLSFLSNINDYLMILVSFFGSMVLLLIGPILNLVNITKNKPIFNSTNEKPKTIIITGATSGLGKGLALAYAQKGITLGLLGRNKERLDEICQECIKKGANVEGVTIDITDKSKMEKWLLSFDKKHTVDIIIANAAVSELMLPKELSFNERTYEITNINVNGMLNTILPLIPNFEYRNKGQIVLVSSLTSYLNFVFPTYCGSKAYVTSFGLTLRNRLSENNVGVTIVAPGYVETPMSDSLKQESLHFSVTPDQASKIILDGISKNKAFIAFSLPTLLITYFINIIPPNLKDAWNHISKKVITIPDYNKKNK